MFLSSSLELIDNYSITQNDATACTSVIAPCFSKCKSIRVFISERHRMSISDRQTDALMTVLVHLLTMQIINAENMSADLWTIANGK